MDQSAGKETIPLATLAYSWRIKYQVINDPLIAESYKRNNTRNNNNKKRNSKFHIGKLTMMILFVTQNSTGPIDLFS